MARPTLIDLISRTDSKGELVPIAEVLNKTSEIVSRLKLQECNMTEGFKHGVRTGLPTATWRKLYGGVAPSKSTTTMVVDTCGNLEATGEVDCDLADLNGNTYAWRMSEQTPFIESMGNTVAETIFYGDTDKNPERFMGLAPRYNTLKTSVPASHNVISMQGTGNDLTSIYLVSMEQFIGLYPKGSKGGLQHTDLGRNFIDAPDNNGKYWAYQDHYKWQIGTSLADWRGCARMCNIKISDLVGGTGQLTADNLIKSLIMLKNRIPANMRNSLVMYVPEEVHTALEVAAMNKSSNVVKIVEAAGQFKTMFFDIPIVTEDAISKSETKVNA